MKKKIWILFGLAMVFAFPQHSMSQTLEDYFKAGAAVGSVIRKKIDKNKAENKALDEELAKAWEELYDEQRKLDSLNNLIRIEKAKKNATSKSYSNSSASKKVLFENDDIVGSGPTIRSNYQDTPIIKSSMTSLLVLYTKDDKKIMLWMPNSCIISYTSYDDNERTLVCNKVVGWIKYYGEDVWHKYEDAFSKILYPSYNHLVHYSEFFPNNYESMNLDDIESMTIQFEDWSLY